MKKIFKIFIFLFFSTILYACKNEKKISIVISEVVHSSDLTAVELYNYSNDDINLDDLVLNVYSNGNVEVDYEIQLNGSIKSKDFYIITYGNTHDDSNVLEFTDLFSKELKYNGNDTIELKHKNKSIVTFGIIGLDADYGSNFTVVKKNEFMEKHDYNEYYYIKYNNSENYLNSIISPMDSISLLEGPKITEEDLNKPFISESNDQQGGGGVITVQLAACGDGDTAKFYYPEYLGFEQGEKIRFLNIDTRETMDHYTQEWGLPAKYYVCDRLKNAKTIQIKSEENHPLREGYGRLWGWIFVDGKLLNLEVAQNGYSDVFADSAINSSYKNITYNNYLLNAYYYAKYNKLGLFGEKDPYWDYTTDSPKK